MRTKLDLLWVSIIGAALILIPIGAVWAATSTYTSLHHMRCIEHSITSTSDHAWILVEKVAGVTLQLEPDDDGAGVGTEVTLYACTGTTTDECSALEWDYDEDGVKDGGVLNGYSEGQRGKDFTIVRPWIYALVSAYSDDGVLAICPIP